jgi:hypothetical protein
MFQISQRCHSRPSALFEYLAVLAQEGRRFRKLVGFRRDPDGIVHGKPDVGVYACQRGSAAGGGQQQIFHHLHLAAFAYEQHLRHGSGSSVVATSSSARGPPRNSFLLRCKLKLFELTYVFQRLLMVVQHLLHLHSVARGAFVTHDFAAVGAARLDADGDKDGRHGRMRGEGGIGRRTSDSGWDECS